MYAAGCPRLDQAEPCRNRDCLFPEPCPGLRADCDRQLEVLEAVRQVPGVTKVSIGTGLRFDLIQGRAGRRYLDELCRRYISGQLRIAPEHVAPDVLRLMRKASPTSYERFIQEFRVIQERSGAKQFLIPYYISGFPGCTLDDMVTLAESIERAARVGLTPHLIRQVQDFTPTPMTLASTMYYTGIDPFTGERLHVAREVREKKLQRAMMQLSDPRSYDYAWRALQRLGSRRLLARIARLGRRAVGSVSAKPG